MMIPATLNEVEQIFLATESHQTRSICVTACHSGDGVTTIAASLAERLLLAGYSTLLVDLNPFKTGFDCQPCLEHQSDIQWLQPINSSQLFTGIKLADNPNLLVNFRNPKFLSKQLTSWLDSFDKIVIDTSPVLQNNKNNIPAQTVASCCDHTFLVVRGGQTTQSHLLVAKQLFDRNNVLLVSSVLNNMQQSSLGEEIVRELNRVKVIPKHWRDKWAQKLLNNEWLSHIA
ncbi:chromosome partitioning protein ParA [Vibrio panuliri]|uniref:Chromosome partitioning protein ParA n=1 Tax=Vibrio panuliri TaxID=1381081 RepID=A0A1Q9HIK8_9VIBR|nr:chromosome partitioning protein ParA [Vibrio panuliri]OLQ90139.1 chromosome partitioning protein ParA [Vibrio panuliri]